MAKKQQIKNSLSGKKSISFQEARAINESLINKGRFSKIVKGVRGLFSKFVNKFQYDFWDEMNSNDIAKSSNPGKNAVSWYRKNYMKNPDAFYQRKMMKMGHLYIFDYDDPIHKKTLEYFDTQPLVLCIGHIVTKDDKVRNLGINLHLLPPKVRRLVLFQIYYMYKSAFSKNLNASKQGKVKVRWQSIVKPLEKFGIGFCIRMYAPNRQTNVINFKQEDWDKAIWIPSKGYSKITANGLEKEWKDYVKNKKTKLVSGESHSSSV